MNVSSTSNTQRLKAVLKTKSVTQYEHSCCSPAFKKAIELYIREKKAINICQAILMHTSFFKLLTVVWNHLGVGLFVSSRLCHFC